MPFRFVNTVAVTTLALARVMDVDLAQDYTVSLGQAPGSEVWTRLGLLVPKAKFVKIEFILNGTTDALARTEWNAVVAYAKTASSLEQTGVSFRAIQGVARSDYQYFGRLRRARCVLELIPNFAYWTTTKAETPAAYTAATKTEF